MSLLFDKLVKGPIFSCQQCGQCLLSQTGYVCPMNCPKGLRNGPCGGTLNGACEVLPDKKCVWVDIYQKDQDAQMQGIRPPMNTRLINTSSLTNYLTGKDKITRLPHAYSGNALSNTGQSSIFAQRFVEKEVVITYEIASPRDTSGLERVAKTAERLNGVIDAINTTTNAGGIPSLHSIETAKVVAQAGVPPIVQFCGRDQGAGKFEAETTEALGNGFANILALTGDWNPRLGKRLNPEHWFPMDSLQMIDILARKTVYKKRPFIGVASNAYTSPMQVSIQRFENKLRAGAHFSQTQAVTETKIFAEWLQKARRLRSGTDCKILVSVPVVGKQRPYEILQRLPGVYIDSEFKTSLDSASDLAVAGLQQVKKLVVELMKLDIDGIHLMNFGVDVEVIADLASEIRSYSKAA